MLVSIDNIDSHPCRAEPRVVFTGEMFAFQRHGGVSRYFCELRRGLSELGVRSVVLAPIWRCETLTRGPGARGLPLPERLEFRGAPRLLRGLSSIDASTRIPLLAKRGNAVLHPTYYRQPRHGPDMPIVMTVFDMIHEDFPQFYPGDRTSETKRRSVASARRIIAISAHTKARLIDQFGINTDRIDVVHLGLSDLWRQPVTPPTDLDLPPFILFVGSRYGYKNFDALLDAFGRSGLAASGVSLLAFGGGEFSSAELRRVHELGLDGRVSQMGGSDSLLAAIYRRAMLLAYPSLDEGFGLPPLEAMASGCPAACSRAGAIPEVVGDAAVMFDPQDQEEIADALVRLTHDSELRDEVIKRGQERAALFTLRQQAEQTLTVYRHALEG